MNKKIIYSVIVFIISISLYIIYTINESQSSKNEVTNINVENQVSKLPQYIGSNSCAECHKTQNEAWNGSHHQLAMQHANVNTVLADFNDTNFSYFDITSRFFKKDNKFYVKTDGPDGKLTDYEIKYVFGVEPLQQYLIEFPGGRLQALGIAWDNRAKDQGGQRWYHLYPDEKIDHTDRLHWTKPDQNWNYMCADCHSTNLKKNYNSENNTYNTQWSEISVGCEACHGPASNHIDWANKKSASPSSTQSNKGLIVTLDDRAAMTWPIDLATGSAKPVLSMESNKSKSNKEIKICARCHSRRSQINHNFKPGMAFMDSYQPALLTEFLYHPDGQIKEEVYVYGSFVQSKMYHKGVTCSHCHEPHSLKLRAEGNGICLRCHSAEKFNTATHHFHEQDSEASLCAECHMPQTTYMGIDGRHDHSIRIPRPDLSLTLNTPNACNQCHQDKTPKWANEKIEEWYGKDWSPGWHFGETLHAANDNSVGIDSVILGQDLAAVAASPKLPVIARATATSLLQEHLNPTTFVVIKKLLHDKEPMIRLSALHSLDNLEPQYRMRLGFDLLNDPILAVRIEAARVLSVVPNQMLSPQQQAVLKNALNEYRQVQHVNADRPESHINLGLLATRLQDYSNAEASYQQALKVDPNFINAYVNLADLYRLQKLDDKAEQTLQQGLQISDQNADLHHAIGLLYVRKKQMDQALHELKTAWRLQKSNVRYGYVYAIALYGEGKTKQSISLLKQLHKSNPSDQDLLIALISYLQKSGDNQSARTYAKRLLKINSQFESVEALLQRFTSP